MGAGVCCALLGADKCLLLSKNWPGQLSGVGGGDCQMMPRIDIQHKFGYTFLVLLQTHINHVLSWQYQQENNLAPPTLQLVFVTGWHGE